MSASRGKSKGKSGGVLARRRAALERAAGRMAEERRAAEEAEAERLRKEAAFDELVVDFELAREDEEAVVAKVEEEVRRVRERGRVRIEAARVAAARVVVAMGEKGETVAGCGRRLGLGAERVKELRRLGRDALAREASGGGSDAGGAKAGEQEQPGGGRAGGGSAGAESAVAGSGDGAHGAGGRGGSSVQAPLAGAAGSPVGDGGGRPGWPQSAG